MNAFQKLNYENNLLIAVLNDGEKDLPKIKVSSTDTEIPEDIAKEFTEHQYYIHNVGFYLVHTLNWCEQLDLSIEFLSNYNYSQAVSSSRADHLTFNIENYLIRLHSVYDRVLQTVNAVFHLCIDAEHVGHNVIITNHKIARNGKVKKALKDIQKYLKKYVQDRHTLIHKHSHQDGKLHRIKRFYLRNLDLKKDLDSGKELKNFRAKYLRDYLLEKKKEFSEINLGLATLLDNLLNLLLEEYQAQKAKLK